MSHIEITHPGGLPQADADAISDLQHSMMNVLPSIKKPEANAMVANMFTLLDALEEKIEGK